MARDVDIIGDLQAEEAVLSSVLCDASVLETVRDYVSADDFWWQEHRKIFEGFLEIDAQGGDLDVVSLSGWLRGKKLHNQITSARLGEIYNSPAVPLAHATSHAKRVRELAQQRRVADACRTIAVEGSRVLDRPVVEFCADAEAAVAAAIELGDTRDAPEGVGLLAAQLVEDTDKREGKPVGHPSGLRALDYHLQGWEPGLYVVAGRPGMGKTALTLEVCKGHARESVERAKLVEESPLLLSVFFSLEMNKQKLAIRLLASEARVTINALRSGRLTDHERDLVTAAAQRLNQIPMVVTHRPGATVAEVRAVARRAHREQRRKFGPRLKLGMVAVDYLQLMSGNKKDGRESEVAGLSRDLMTLAGELNVPVLELSQLNRAVEERPNKRPRMSDLRESGAIEQDADVILFPYRDEYYHPETEAKGLVEVGIGKNRNGEPGNGPLLAFQGKYARFHDRNTPDQDGQDYQPDYVPD